MNANFAARPTIGTKFVHGRFPTVNRFSLVDRRRTE
jgi:hypothetical protein